MISSPPAGRLIPPAAARCARPHQHRLDIAGRARLNRRAQAGRGQGICHRRAQPARRQCGIAQRREQSIARHLSRSCWRRPAQRAGLGPARRRAASRGRIGRPRRIPAPGSSRPHPYLWIRRAPVLAPSVPPARSTAAFPRCEGLVDVGLVLLQEAHRLLERVAAERIAQFLAHHHLQHRGLALGLRLAGRAQRVAHLVGVLDPQALRPHSARQLGEVRVLQIAADETATVEVHLVLLFRAPLAVMEHHRRHRNALAHAGQQFLEAHAPGAVAHIGHGRTIGPAQLGADQRRQRVAAVAEAHGRQHGIRFVEAQIAVGHRADIADVGGHHHMLGHGQFQLAQYAARMHAAAAPADDVQAPVVALVRPAVQFLFPGALLGNDAVGARAQRGRAGQLARGQLGRQRRRRRLGVAADAHRHRAHQPQHAMVGVHLDDAGVLGPVIQPVLRQGAEGPEPRAQRQHHVGLGQELHAGLGALVAQRAAPQRMARRKASLCR